MTRGLLFNVTVPSDRSENMLGFSSLGDGSRVVQCCLEGKISVFENRGQAKTTFSFLQGLML